MYFKNIFWGIILICVGLFFMIKDITGLEIGRYFWPVLFIIAGGLLLLRNQLRERN